jgi:hypothetical protein
MHRPIEREIHDLRVLQLLSKVSRLLEALSPQVRDEVGSIVVSHLKLQ